MNDDEWYEFQVNCYSMDYKHPSGNKICLEQEVGDTYWNKRNLPCDKDTCPKI